MPKKKCPEQADSIPAWFMTYSDVITLMMTFFILLLTFSTDQPERFEQLQVVMFGGGGASGLAGPSNGPLDKNSFVLRVRPLTSRQTMRGSEMPPLESDPSLESLSRGLSSLDEIDDLVKQQRQALQVSLSLMTDEEGGLTAIGRQQMRMIAQMLTSRNLSVRLEVSDTNQVARVMALVQALAAQPGVKPGRIEVGVGRHLDIPETHFRITLSRMQTSGR